MPVVSTEDRIVALVDRVAEWGRAPEAAMPTELVDELQNMTGATPARSLFSSLCGGGGPDAV